MMDARRRTRVSCFVGTLVAYALVASNAFAVDREAEKKSRELYKQARAAEDAGKWKEACPLYQAAHELNSTSGTAAFAAYCYEKIDKLDRALDLYQFVLDHRATDTNAERVRVAEERVTALRKQLGLDKPHPTLPTWPALAASPTASVPDRRPAWVLLGVGAASTLTGAVLGGLALAQAAEVRAQCSSASPCAFTDPSWDAAHAANAKAAGAIVAFGIGAVGVAAGVTLYVLGLPKVQQRVQSAVGPLGITLHF